MGCILALDMTVECLYAKIAYLYGKVSAKQFNSTAFLGLQQRKDQKDDDEKPEKENKKGET